MVAGGDAGGGKGWVARNSFFFLPSLFLLGGLIYTHLTGGRRSVHCFFFRYRPFHSAPNTRPLASFILSHFHWIITMHAHTRSITPFSLSLPFSLSFTHILSVVLSYSLTLSYSSDIFSFFFFFSFLVIYTRAFMFVVFSYSATFKYRIFRNN